MNWTAAKGHCSRLGNVWLLIGIMLIALPLAAETARMYVVYKNGTARVGAFDLLNYKVTQTIKDIEWADGMNFSPDGRRVYVASETDKVLAVVDRNTGEIIEKVPLTGTPNTIAITKDGGRLFVAIREAPGALDVIDTTSLKRVKSIAMKSGLHDIVLTPDGNYVVMGSEAGKSITVLDVKTEQPIWDVKFEDSVATIAVDAGPDGSTRRIYVNRHGLHGFEVVDFEKRQIVAQIKLPENANTAAGKLRGDDADNPCHGIGVAPDKKTLWANSRWDDAVFVYSLPDLKLLGQVLTGPRPVWIDFSPDSKTVYDANSGESTVSVIDARALKEVARIPVATRPVRIYAAVRP
jgi:YVTN family beta-propeller protein